MRLFLYFFILVLFVSCNHEEDKMQENDGQYHLTEQQILQHLTNRNDSSTWDIKMFKWDLDDKIEASTGPFKVGVFPEPHYDLIGKESFAGLKNYGVTGSGNNYKKIKDKKILYNSFFVEENSLNRKHLNGKPDEMFFQIIVLTDSIDFKRFSHVGSIVLSRNHPDYFGQGYFLSKNNRIDYSAFITVQNDSYAIVNTRIFNLKYGKTILIAPQKDGSLRSRQIKSPSISSKGIDRYTDRLLNQKDIIEFFTAQGSI